jgi:uncharacterized YigZ family protein
VPETPADSYRSLDDGEEVEIREKGSRFVGQAFRADDEATAEARLAGVRKRYHAATHHCSARRVGPPGATLESADDDGEPSGTAGPPILSVLLGEDVHDAIVVVTRWFGGTKLGKGGLIRAYSEAAREALAAAPRRTVWREAIVTIGCAWPDVGAIEAVLGREAARLRKCERDFADEPRFLATVLASDAERLRAAVVEATGGRARAAVVSEASTA